MEEKYYLDTNYNESLAVALHKIVDDNDEIIWSEYYGKIANFYGLPEGFEKLGDEYLEAFYSAVDDMIAKVLGFAPEYEIG